MADINININILDADVSDFKAGVLKCKPKQGADVSLTDLQYLKALIQRDLFNMYKTGKQIIAQETTSPSINEDIVTVT